MSQILVFGEKPFNFAANSDFDPTTGKPWEAIDPGVIELIYQHDPGWFLHSVPGCLYFLWHIDKEKPAPNTPVLDQQARPKAFALLGPAPELQHFSKIYSTWLYTEKEAVRIRDKYTHRDETGNRVANQEMKRAIYLGRKAMEDCYTLGEGRLIMAASLEDPIGDENDRTRDLWDLTMVPFSAPAKKVAQETGATSSLGVQSTSQIRSVARI